MTLTIQLEDLGTGKIHKIDRWTSYAVTQDLFGMDTFTASMAAVEHQRKFTAHGGQLATVKVDGALQSTAITDERSEAVNVSNTDLHISGRGVGGLLLDSAVDPRYLSLKNLTLQRVIERIVSPYFPIFITAVTTNMAASRYVVAGGKSSTTVKAGPGYPVSGEDRLGRPTTHWKYPTKKVINANYKPWGKDSPVYRGVDQESLKNTRIQPGEKIWEVIQRLCKQVASHPYVAADGNVVIMRPQYKFNSSAYGDGIVLKWDAANNRATGGNVKRAQMDTSIADRHSEIIVWGTGKSKKTAVGKDLLKNTHTVKDPSPAFWNRVAAPPFLGTAKISKKEIITVKNIRDKKLVRRMARGMMEETAVKAFSLDYEINGHTINGALPTVDSMIRVDDDRFNLHDSFYIVKVSRRMDMNEGKSTVLSLIPPEIWLAVDHDAMGDDEYTAHMAQRIFW